VSKRVQDKRIRRGAGYLVTVATMPDDVQRRREWFGSAG
jgi:hypothetical protein